MTAPLPHVVVVDDEREAREMVGDYLKMHGFDVELCEGGASLRAHLTSRTPDLIVLDLNMPEEDGLSIVRRLNPVNRRAASSRWRSTGSTSVISSACGGQFRDDASRCVKSPAPQPKSSSRIDARPSAKPASSRAYAATSLSASVECAMKNA